MPRPAERARPRILIAEDDAQVRRFLSHVLREEGYEVEAVPDGAVALDLHRKHPAQLVLLDMYLPGVDGLETMIRLRQEFPKLPIIAMSGGGHLEKEDLLDMAKRLGADAVLSKPIEKKTLLEGVKQWIRGAP
jgi:CheY-like chemotaxis protein